MLNRVKDWRKHLAYAAEEELAFPFSWEEHNCGHWMGTAIKAVLGDHPILGDLQTGKSREEVRAFVESRSGLQGILSAHFDEIPSSHATDGDIGIFETPEGNVGVVVLNGKGVAKTEDGRTAFIKLTSLAHVYRVTNK